MSPLSPEEFAKLITVLGPFGPAPHLAVAVSGGPDSLALAVLAAEWAASVCGTVSALILDHGLRSEGSLEAEKAARELGQLRIRARIFHLHGITTGAGVPARARRARHARLEAAAAEIGAAWLLLGHQRADQAETVLERALSHSGPAGLAGMAARRESARVAILRPLLDIPPGRLIATLAARGIGFAQDPSNSDPAFLRARLRSLRADGAGEGVATSALGIAAAAAGRARAAAEAKHCSILAERASLYDAGYALLTPGPIAPAVLASLLRIIAGVPFAPSEARIVALAACPHAATVAGARLLPAGRLGPGWLLVREACAMAQPIPAIPGVRWDRRFRLAASARPPLAARLGALGARSAADLRRRSTLPAVVLATLPALRVGEELVAVPHLGYPCREVCARLPIRFSPNQPAAGAPFGVMDRAGDAEPTARAYLSL
ncbi:MAG: tRNA lysidine(34) synthetase TilS [Acetobacteraceae bacterium]